MPRPSYSEEMHTSASDDMNGHKDLQDENKGEEAQLSECIGVSDVPQEVDKKRAISSVLAGGLGMLSDGYQVSTRQTAPTLTQTHRGHKLTK